MRRKILFILIVFGVISVGTATYALFNENILLDATSGVATNDSSLLNNQSDVQSNQSDVQSNQSNVQSNQSNVQSNQSSRIVTKDSNLSFGEMVVVLDYIDVINNDCVEKVVKEVGRVIDNGGVHIFYDDLSRAVIIDNHTWHIRDVLTPIFDAGSVSGGYVICADCGKFIPVGDVLGLVPENYLCNCPDEHPKSVKDVSYVYSEENVLTIVQLKNQSLEYDNRVGISVDNTFEVDSANMSDGDSNPSSIPDSDGVISKEVNPNPDFAHEFYPNGPNNPNYFEHGTGIICDKMSNIPFTYNPEPMTD